MNIDELYESLSWSRDESCQRRVREQILANADFDYGKLMQPSYGKNCWHNCALMLAEIPEARLKRYVPQMLRWLQDLNWPGADIILKKLQTFPKEYLYLPLEDAVREASRTKDSAWLDYLSLLIKKEGLDVLLDPEVSEVLKQHYFSFWGS